jgi:glycosyltransferase involved in cell wall biosynthesis
VKASLVATVMNAGPDIHDFLASVAAQTRAPDEVVVVDGGSTDGTLDALRADPGVVVIEESGANIARGRNLAIRSATHDVIAVTDADCVLDPHWLEFILEPIERGARVVAGAYRPLARTPWQVAAAAHIPDPEELRAGWLPSSRSLAIQRDAFDAVGGYPEWLEVGEDMYLNHRWVELGIPISLAPAAVTSWRVRPTLAATWRQYERYAEGDALAGMYPERHALRFIAYAGAGLALATRRPLFLGFTAVAAALYVSKAVRRASKRGGWAAMAAVPPMTAFLDAAKMAGYIHGLVARRHARPPAR